MLGLEQIAELSLKLGAGLFQLIPEGITRDTDQVGDFPLRQIVQAKLTDAACLGHQLSQTVQQLLEVYLVLDDLGYGYRLVRADVAADLSLVFERLDIAGTAVKAVGAVSGAEPPPIAGTAAAAVTASRFEVAPDGTVVFQVYVLVDRDALLGAGKIDIVLTGLLRICIVCRHLDFLL